MIIDFANPLRNAHIVSVDTNDDDYHQINRGRKRGDAGWVMTRSELVAFHQCPRKWIDVDAGGEDKKSDAMRFGSLVDCLVLTPKFYPTRYAIAPEELHSKRTNAWKAFEAAAMESGRNAILASEHEKVSQCAARLIRDFPLIATSQRQVWVTAEFFDKQTCVTVPIQVLIDLVPDKNGEHGRALADLKTTRSAIPEAWANVTHGYGYHIQAALYTDAFNDATGEDRTSWLHCVAENEHPFQTAPIRLGDAFLEIGREKYVSALRDYCRAIASGCWQGYELRCQTLGGWMLIEPKPWMNVDGNGRGELSDLTAVASEKVSGEFIP